MLKLIYIGDHFYRDSKTMMSSIYTEDRRRSDWGFVQVALRAGKNVEIRQATEIERAFFDEKLAEIKAKHGDS